MVAPDEFNPEVAFRFLPYRRSRLVLGLLELPGISRTVWKIGGDLLSRRDISNKLSISCNIFAILQLSNSKIYFFLNLS